jgi:transitional endoplasmic reticulum ATPase
LIRIDGYIRNKLDVGINDTIEVRKVQSKDAKNITFAPTEPLRIVGAEEYLGEYLNGQLMTKGDTIPISVMGQRIDLVVISTNPSGPVIISDSTKITVSEESAKAVQISREGGVPSITYEDIGGLGDAVGRVRDDRASFKTPGTIQKVRGRSAQGCLVTRSTRNRKDIAGKSSGQ